MKVAFTICTNSYLAKAKVVADTFIDKHPEYSFYIFLVDKFDDSLNYEPFDNYQIVEVDKITPQINDLALQYDIIELSTAVKAAAFIYLFKQKNAASAIYLDPDLMIFDRFKEVEDQLDNGSFNIVLTPHFCSPIDDGKYPSDIHFLPFGLYNLGFIALRNSEESQRFLLWWHERLMKYCYFMPEKGMFTDQLWVNYAPIFFEGVAILKHLGYNAANWNLYERKINEKDSVLYVNNQYRLKFFHFSSYQFDNPYSISKNQDRHTINEREDLRKLIDLYQSELIQNEHQAFAKVQSFYQHLFGVQKQLEYNNKMKQYPLRLRVRNKLVSILGKVIPD